MKHLRAHDGDQTGEFTMHVASIEIFAGSCMWKFKVRPKNSVLRLANGLIITERNGTLGV